MKTAALYYVFLILVSCSVKQPEERDVKKVVLDSYISFFQLTSGENVNTWPYKIDTINVVNIKQKSRRVFECRCIVKGTIYFQPHHEPRFKMVFADSIKLDISSDKNGWVENSFTKKTKVIGYAGY